MRQSTAKVVETGGSSIGPVLHVMRVAPPTRRSAPGDDAAAVAGGERSSHTAAYDSGHPADIEHLRLAGGDDPCDLGVAGELPGGPGRDHPCVVELTGAPGSAFECVYGEVDHDVGAFGALCREFTVVQMIPAQVDEGIGSALCRNPVVGGV